MTRVEIAVGNIRWRLEFAAQELAAGLQRPLLIRSKVQSMGRHRPVRAWLKAQPKQVAA